MLVGVPSHAGLGAESCWLGVLTGAIRSDPVCPIRPFRLGALGTASARTAGVCPHAVELAADCKAAAARLAAAVPARPTAGGKTCGCGAVHPGTYLSGMATAAPAAGWDTLAEAETWCCAHATGCGGVTFQSGSYTARAGTTPMPNSLKVFLIGA